MSELLNQAKALAPEIVRWRRHIHENPEVSAVLPNTCAYVTAELRKMGYEPYPVGGGVVAMLDGQPDGKVILLRADMDALPMAEESGEPFASKNPHAAHTCGHDTHTAMLLGAAKILNDYAEDAKANFSLKAGMVEGKIFDKAGIEAIAKLPSKDQLLAQLCSVLNGNIRGLAVALNAIAEKGEQEIA